MADKKDPVNDNNDRNRVSEGWTAISGNKEIVTWLRCQNLLDKIVFLQIFPIMLMNYFFFRYFWLKMFYKVLYMKQTSMQKLFSQRRKMLCPNIQDFNNGKTMAFHWKIWKYSLPWHFILKYCISKTWSPFGLKMKFIIHHFHIK